jgi:hypothetical protein
MEKEERLKYEARASGQCVKVSQRAKQWLKTCCKFNDTYPYRDSNGAAFPRFHDQVGPFILGEHYCGLCIHAGATDGNDAERIDAFLVAFELGIVPGKLVK